MSDLLLVHYLRLPLMCMTQTNAPLDLGFFQYFHQCLDFILFHHLASTWGLRKMTGGAETEHPPPAFSGSKAAGRAGLKKDGHTTSAEFITKSHDILHPTAWLQATPFHIRATPIGSPGTLIAGSRQAATNSSL